MRSEPGGGAVLESTRHSRDGRRAGAPSRTPCRRTERSPPRDPTLTGKEIALFFTVPARPAGILKGPLVSPSVRFSVAPPATASDQVAATRVRRSDDLGFHKPRAAKLDMLRSQMRCPLSDERRESGT